MMRIRPFFIRCRLFSSDIGEKAVVSVVKSIKNSKQKADSLHFSHKLKQNLSKFDFQSRYFELVDSFFDGHEVSVKNLLATHYYDLKSIVCLLRLRDSNTMSTAFSSLSKPDLIHMIANKNMTREDFTGIIVKDNYINGDSFIRSDLGVGLSRPQILELCVLTHRELKKLCKAHQISISSACDHPTRRELLEALVRNGVYPSKPVIISNEQQLQQESQQPQQIDMKLQGSRASMSQLFKQAKVHFIKLQMGIRKEKIIELLKLHEQGLLGPEMYELPTVTIHPQLKSLFEMKDSISDLCALSMSDLRQKCLHMNILTNKATKFDLICLISNCRLNNLPDEFKMNDGTKRRRVQMAEYFRKNGKTLISPQPVATAYNRRTRSKTTKDDYMVKSISVTSEHLIIDNVDINHLPNFQIRNIVMKNDIVLPKKGIKRHEMIQILQSHVKNGYSILLPPSICHLYQSYVNPPVETSVTKDVSLIAFSHHQLRRIATANHLNSKDTKINLCNSLKDLSSSGIIIKIPVFEQDVKIGQFKLTDFTRNQLYFLIRSHNIGIIRANTDTNCNTNGTGSSSNDDGSSGLSTIDCDSKHLYTLNKIEMARVLQAHIDKGGSLDFQAVKHI